MKKSLQFIQTILQSGLLSSTSSQTEFITSSKQKIHQFYGSHRQVVENFRPPSCV